MGLESREWLGMKINIVVKRIIWEVILFITEKIETIFYGCNFGLFRDGTTQGHSVLKVAPVYSGAKFEPCFLHI